MAQLECCLPLLELAASRLAPRGSNASGPVQVNVGGRIFVTSVATLASGRAHGSRLQELVDQASSQGGVYFLDRDGSLYHHVLSFLRDGADGIHVTDQRECRQLLTEAKALRLQELVDHLTGMLASWEGVPLQSEKLPLRPPVQPPTTSLVASDVESLKADDSFKAPNLKAESLKAVTKDVTMQPRQLSIRACPAPLPMNEAQRLEKLMSLGVLDTDQETHYDCITRVVAGLLEVPIVLISLVADDRQWFKSRCGLDVAQTDRDSSFCAYTLVPDDLEAHTMFVIEDTLRDSRFRTNPLVQGFPKIRFYAGCPLVTSEGLRLGALCAIDQKSKALTPGQAQVLVNFAQITVQEIEASHLATKINEDPYNSEITDISFAGGFLRAQRMREAVEECICLVWARSDSLDWPMLYANQVWTDLTGFQVVPPKSFPGQVVIKALDETTTTPGRSIWDFMRLSSVGSDQVTDIWNNVRGKVPAMPGAPGMQKIPEPRAFHLLASLLVNRMTNDGKSDQARVMMDCRFSPAELPIDASAGAIRALGAGQDGPPVLVAGMPPGRLYFLTMRKSPEQDRLQVERTPETLVHTTRTSRTSEETFTMNSGSNGAISAASAKQLGGMKQPKPPCEDVRLIRLIGQGSFGSVYFGLWSGAPVAVKIIRTMTKGLESINPQEKQNFEASLSASISHPNLVQTYKHGGHRISGPQAAQNQEASARPNGSHQSRELKEIKDSKDVDDAKEASAFVFETWIVQEWCDGGSLRERSTEPRVEGKALLDVIEIGMEISWAGAYLHDLGIIHGDLTANNVLTKNAQTRKGFMCKVCDFGLARVLEGESQEIITQTMGTVTHMPPELFSMQSDCCRLSQKADVFALGMILYEVISGQAPYSKLSAPQVVVQVSRGKRQPLPEQVPRTLVDVYKACVAGEPKDRPTLAELTKLLAKFHESLMNGEQLE